MSLPGTDIVDDNICPATGDEDSPIFLNKLEEDCSWEFIDLTFKEFIADQFDTKCVNNSNCTLDISKS